jgi:hypothetical protein
MEVSGRLHAPAGLLPERTPGTQWIGGWVGPRDKYRQGIGCDKLIAANFTLEEHLDEKTRDSGVWICIRSRVITGKRLASSDGLHKIPTLHLPEDSKPASETSSILSIQTI